MNLNEQFSKFLDTEDEVTIAESYEILDEMDVEQLDPSDDDAYMLHLLAPELIDPNEPVDMHEEIDEARVLTVPQRMKLSSRMKRMAKRLANIRKLKATRMAPTERLKYRARKAALMSIRKRVAGQMGKNYSELTPQQKIQVDQMVSRRFNPSKLRARIEMLANRLMMGIRKKEVERLEKVRSGSGEEKKEVHEQKKKTDEAGDPEALTLKDPLKRKGDAHTKDKGDPHHLTDFSRRHKIIKYRVNEGKLVAEEEFVDIDESAELDEMMDEKQKERRKKAFYAWMNDKSKNAEKNLPVNRSAAMKKRESRKTTTEETELDEARKSKDADQGDAGDTNIIYQMRKVLNLRGKYTVKWADGTSSNVSPQDAMKALNKYHTMMTTPGTYGKDRQSFVRALGKNPANFKKMIAEEVEEIDEGGRPGSGYYVPTDDPYNPSKSIGMTGVLKNFGWKKEPKGGNSKVNIYSHPDHPKQRLTTGTANMFYHRKDKDADPGDMSNWIGRGRGAGELHKHLSKFHGKGVKEEVEFVDEARMPLAGHPYHKKTDAELHYIRKDANQAAKAMRGHNEKAENKYLDQVNDAETVLHYRSKGGKRITEEGTKKKSGNEWKVDPLKYNPPEPVFSRPNQMGMGPSNASMQGEASMYYPAPEMSPLSHAMPTTPPIVNSGDPRMAQLQRKKAQLTSDIARARVQQAQQRARKALQAVSKRKAIHAHYDVRDDLALQRKAEESGVDIEVLREVYERGVLSWTEEETQTPTQYGFSRVNSFISGGAAIEMDADLLEEISEEDLAPIKPMSRIQRIKKERDSVAAVAAWKNRREAGKSAVVEAEFKTKIRRADLRVVKVHMPDGTFKYKRIRPMANVQHEDFAMASHSASKPWVEESDEKQDTGKSPKMYQKVREALSGKARLKESVNEDFVPGIYDAPTAADFGMKAQGSFAHHPDVEDELYEQELGFTEEVFQVTGDEQYEDWGEKLDISEATYQGKSVSLGKPFLTPGGPKKRAVYVQNDKGNVVKVNFGDPNMTIKKNDPARRRSFRARHHCDTNPGPRHKARYWSCRAW